MLPKYYEFQNSTKILSGQKALENIAYELEGLEAGRPMVLSDQVLEKIGALQKVLDAMLSQGSRPAAVFTDIPADSSVEVVNEITKRYKENNCDSLVAIGGGSVMDTAKGTAIMIAHGVDDLLKLQGCEFITVPTTSGTGSEMTMVAVIKNEKKAVKMEFISNHMLPDVAVLDPRMTETLPPRITASTGFDALCHAMEAYSCTQKNPLSDAYATAAITMVREYLVKAVTDGKDPEARLAMANASTMAGAAFSNSMVGAVHGIGHALGGVCHVPHGDAMTILLPHVMRYNLGKLDEVYGELLLYLAGPEIYAQTAREERGKEAIRTVRRLQRKLNRICGLPMRLQDAGVNPGDFETVAVTALRDGAMLANPVAVDKEDVIRILKKAY